MIGVVTTRPATMAWTEAERVEGWTGIAGGGAAEHGR